MQYAPSQNGVRKRPIRIEGQTIISCWKFERREKKSASSNLPKRALGTFRVRSRRTEVSMSTHSDKGISTEARSFDTENPK